MRIIVDAFGGDNAPLEVIKGAVQAKKQLDIDITLVGDEETIRKCALDNKVDITGLDLAHADTVIPVTEDPGKILKEYKNSSMAVGLAMLKDGKGDAFVSAGSTGALVMGTTFIVKRLKGIKRCALATVMPTSGGPCMILDCGANAEVRPEIMNQFAIMGSAYMNKLMGTANPRVALVNIGTEPNKGREVDVETYKLLSANSSLNFVGNIEARQVPMGDADVVVADGFAGNIMLKSLEGMAKLFSNSLKDMLKSGPLSLLGAACLAPKLSKFKKKMDYKEYGGAPLLGSTKPVIKAHGSSDAKAFCNAIKQAVTFCENDVINEFSAALTANSEE